MHTTIDYSGQDYEVAKQAALNDIEEYLGTEWYNKLTEEFKKWRLEDMTLERFTCYMGIAGISGFPVRMWHEHIYGNAE